MYNVGRAIFCKLKSNNVVDSNETDFDEVQKFTIIGRHGSHYLIYLAPKSEIRPLFFVSEENLKEYGVDKSYLKSFCTVIVDEHIIKF